jgi:hypothetical protein
MVRVIRLAPDDPLIWQKALLQSEVRALNRCSLMKSIDPPWKTSSTNNCPVCALTFRM